MIGVPRVGFTTEVHRKLDPWERGKPTASDFVGEGTLITKSVPHSRPMPKATQLVIPLENRPGTLAHLCSTLGEGGVNITAILAPEGKKKGKVSLMVEDLDAARDTLKEARIRFSEEEVLEVDIDNRPGAFGKVAGKLAESKINIDFVYVTTSPYGRAKVVMGVKDVGRALRALGE